MTSISGPAYRIVTERLILRCWNPEDAGLLNAAVDESRAHLKPWMPWAHQTVSLEERIDYLRNTRARFDRGEDFVYGIFAADEGRVLGGTGLHTRVGAQAREIGYWIHADFISKGFATETAAALTRAAFEIDGVERVEIHCDPENIRSASVPRKLGYTHEATLRRNNLFLNEWRDSMIWTLFREDYPKSLAAQSKFEAYDAARRRIL